MASRRDELNAYTFARKRMVGAFLQPSGGGNDEDAPRPVRAVLPSIVVGAVIVAGFGMWGVIKPAAPLHWDEGKNIIQGKTSTTRYVLLPEGEGANRHMVLHQVLNMSSARLVLPAGAQVMIVADDVLDKYKWRGATIGIPYAPDKLPKDTDAGQTKTWSVCDRLTADANTQAAVNQAVFVAAGDEQKTLADPKRRVGDGQSLFVMGPNTGNPPDNPSKFLVDGNGVRHAVGTDGSKDTKSSLERALFGDGAQAQQVTANWLETLVNGSAITFPTIPGFDPAKQVASSLTQISKPEDRKVGRLLSFQKSAYYVVGVDRLFQVTPFQAELIRLDPALKLVYGGSSPTFADMSPADRDALQSKIDPAGMAAAKDLPTDKAPAINIGKDARNVICSSFDGMDNKTIKRSVWAGTEYPATFSSGSASAHVTPGHGVLYRAFDGDNPQDSSGSDFLITETGLRYSLPANNDGGQGGASPTAPAAPDQAPGDKKEANESQARLGYKSVAPVMVPGPWSRLVPAGPVLDTNTAVQAQNA
ncbi:type VII secretion protein EccB [Kitasatospora paracochleata]|uniref:Type VII secretion protein EccB n=1 Tax=Kitasatospora paracochleata TaxID=58354 RepID=A0ABT1IYS3_9ACTN|nr:type VII secretion protein EccB [Kitasatospora paracochleata]MCP2310302.1 type VII secretion protein EccB [Kitasatospora paracochleata]